MPAKRSAMRKIKEVLRGHLRSLTVPKRLSQSRHSRRAYL